MSDGLTLPCARCGEVPTTVDYTVDDEFWKASIPKKWRAGVVCLCCLCEISTPALVAGALTRVQLTFNGVTIDCDPRRAYIYDERKR